MESTNNHSNKNYSAKIWFTVPNIIADSSMKITVKEILDFRENNFLCPILHNVTIYSNCGCKHSTCIYGVMCSNENLSN